MCFSAPASFTSGVLLTFVGTETLKKVHKPSQIALACISLFFAFQQFTEGVLWLTIGRAGYAGLQTVSTYIFVIMAEVIWPILVPFSVLIMEENKTRKRILYVLQTIGAAVGLYYLYRLMFYDVKAAISIKHIVYNNTAPHSSAVLSIVFYLAATIIPLFVSSIKRIYIVGIVMGISFIVAALFYQCCLISVWCFFAAVISFIIFYIIKDAHKKFHFIKQTENKKGTTP
jgi:hypothetical protein